MPVSQNGYTFGDISLTQLYTVTKDGRQMRFYRGAPGEMLADFFLWFDENIRDIDAGILDDWSWAVRVIRDGEAGSNHGSGTAGDVNATKWPLGSEASVYLTADEIARVNTKLKEYRGCIRWGANYTGRKDPMHFEINADLATVIRVWADIQAARKPAEPSVIVRAMQIHGMHYLDLGKVADGFWGPVTDKDVYAIRQAAYAHQFPFNVNSVQRLVGSQVVDGIWNTQDEVLLMGTVKVFQRAWGIVDDGVWGIDTERTWKAFQQRLYVG
jgi:hypothetical protein